MRKLIVYQVDAFTTEKLKGNPAGVFINADGLGEREMQMIARELNNSETAFIFSSNDTSYDGIIRYFTPTKEVPICGHATIGAMYALAQERKLDSCVLRMKTEVGILPFEVIKEKIAQIYPEAIVTSYITKGGTDAYKYQIVSDHIYRLLPLELNEYEQRTIHNENEYISLENFGKVQLYFKEIMRTY